MNQPNKTKADDSLDLYPLCKAVELATNCKIHPQTAHNWATVGVRGVRLRSWLLGARRRKTTIDAVLEFLRDTNEEDIDA